MNQQFQRRESIVFAVQCSDDAGVREFARQHGLADKVTMANGAVVVEKGMAHFNGWLVAFASGPMLMSNEIFRAIYEPAP